VRRPGESSHPDRCSQRRPRCDTSGATGRVCVSGPRRSATFVKWLVTASRSARRGVWAAQNAHTPQFGAGGARNRALPWPRSLRAPSFRHRRNPEGRLWSPGIGVHAGQTVGSHPAPRTVVGAPRSAFAGRRWRRRPVRRRTLQLSPSLAAAPEPSRPRRKPRFVTGETPKGHGQVAGSRRAWSRRSAAPQDHWRPLAAHDDPPSSEPADEDADEG
jgi:hypothetical protein